MCTRVQENIYTSMYNIVILIFNEYNWNININDIYFSTVIIRVIRESNQNGFTRGQIGQGIVNFLRESNRVKGAPSLCIGRRYDQKIHSYVLQLHLDRRCFLQILLTNYRGVDSPASTPTNIAAEGRDFTIQIVVCVQCNVQTFW